MIKLLIGGSPCTKWSIAQKKDRETTAELEEELRQNALGADNNHDIQYWRAYRDGAIAQAEEDGYTEEALK